MEHRELQDLIPAHALDALDADDALLLDGHLETCEECRRELDELRETTALLAFASKPIEPPASLRAKILDAVADTTPAPAPAPRARPGVPPGRVRRRPRRRGGRARHRHRAARPAERRAQRARRARREPPALRKPGSAARGQPCEERSSATARPGSSSSSTCRRRTPGHTYEAWLIGSDKTPVPGRTRSRAARRSSSASHGDAAKAKRGRDHASSPPAARSSRRRRRSPARRLA